MTDDDRPQPPSSVTQAGADAPTPANSTPTALVAALMAKIEFWHDWFRKVADEIATDKGGGNGPDFDHDCYNAQEASVRLRHMDAALHRNHLNTRARLHGVVFSVTAQAHHRAALLHALDDPYTPIPLAHRQLTVIQPVDEDGYPDTSPAHPAAHALYRLKSRQYPALYPPERLGWTALQWNEHEQSQYAAWLAKCSPAARAQLTGWAIRINAERDSGTCTISWRAPGHHGPRRRLGVPPT